MTDDNDVDDDDDDDNDNDSHDENEDEDNNEDEDDTKMMIELKEIMMIEDDYNDDYEDDMIMRMMIMMIEIIMIYTVCRLEKLSGYRDCALVRELLCAFNCRLSLKIDIVQLYNISQ